MAKTGPTVSTATPGMTGNVSICFSLSLLSRACPGIDLDGPKEGSWELA